MTPPLEREAIFPRIDGIKKNVKKLQELSKLDFGEFSAGDPYDLAQHHLRLALEGIFHIANHILSRLPGGRAIEYREIAKKMGEQGIVPKDFALIKLVPMAGLRNILVHHYSDLEPKRLYAILQNHLVDILEFLKHIRVVLDHPKSFNLEIR